MLKRFSVIVLIALFLISSITAVAKVTDNKNAKPGHVSKKRDLEKVYLLGDISTDDEGGPFLGSAFRQPPFTYTPVGNFRDIYDWQTTQEDRQHYTSPGRQIVYAGYFNAGCNYVYIDWSHRQELKTKLILRSIRWVPFDWTNHEWPYGLIPNPVDVFVGTVRFLDPNIDATPDNGSSVVSCYDRDPGLPWYSRIAYSNVCPIGTGGQHVTQQLPGSPNREGITTGYCDDNLGDQTVSPYVWPIIDVDTTDDGRVITHVARNEWGFCTAVPSSDIDASSLTYSRKISLLGDIASSGTWQGPYFMDSVYNIAHIVRSDKRSGNHTVYLAYLKPPYYRHGSPHPCAGNGHYQITSEVVYKVSTSDGDSGTWSAPIYITDYYSGFEDGKTEPAVYEISAMVDPSGCFHVVWLSANRDPDDFCGAEWGCKLWHWDNCNRCISMAYDASHPNDIGAADPGAWNWMVAKPNISWCDNNFYILFTRFGTHTAPGNPDLAIDAGDNNYLNGDLMVVCSDATGNNGQVWTNGFNLTDTESDSCLAGNCQSEHWPTMAMYSNDSLMIQYILDLEPGGKGDPNDEPDCSWTNNPVIFMTWPCFSMADMGSNACMAVTPNDKTFEEVPLAPNGQTAGCNTPAADTADVILSNCGNVNLSYTATSDQSWLTILSGNGGDVLAGTGPRGSDDPAWGTSTGADSAASGCAAPATITWRAASSGLSQGNYVGHINVDIEDDLVEDFSITINLVVTCLYYVPEYATITGGCWKIDLWNTPKAGNGIENDEKGNITYYQCGADSTIAPLYMAALAIGWKEGATTKMFGDAISQDSSHLWLRALSPIYVDSVGNPSGGEGYYWTKGEWSTPEDSVIKGTIEYFVPGHLDTPVVIQKIVLTNTGSTTLNNFVVGEEVDWDCEADSSVDKGDTIKAYQMVFMQGDHPASNENPLDDQLAAGLSPYSGYDANFGAAAINGYDYAYYTLGWYPDTLYNYLTGLDNTYYIFSDSTNGTEMRTLHRFWEGSLAPGQTIEIIVTLTVTLEGESDLVVKIEIAITFIKNTPTIKPFEFTNYCQAKEFRAVKGKQANFHYESASNACCNSYLYEKMANGDWIKRREWNYNDGLTRKYEVSETSTGIFKIKNNNSDFKVGVTFSDVEKETTPSNPEDYSGFSLGWGDDSAEEFGDHSGPVTITGVNTLDSFNLSNAPRLLGTGGASPLTVGFETYDNEYWDHMELYFDFVDVNTAGTLTIACADADSPSVELPIVTDSTTYTYVLGGLDHNVSSQLVITAVGSFEIDSWGLRYFVPCSGRCGNANNDASVNVADAVWIINYVFAGGLPPQPVLACGNANNDTSVNVADAVWIINYVFAGGLPPGDCHPGAPLWIDGDCCPF